MRDKLVQAAAKALSDFPLVLDGESEAVTRQAAQAAVDAVLEAMRDVENDILGAGYEAMFKDKWDGTQAPMMGAGWDAMLAEVRQ